MNTTRFSTPKKAIFLTIALDLIGLTIIFPLLPLFQEHFGVSYLLIGIMGASYAFCSFISAPYLGRLSDRFGRRNILLASVIGSAIGWLITGFAPNFWWVIIGRVIDGITAGNITIAQAILSDISRDQKERTKYFGIFGMMFGMAMIVGPLLGWFLAQFGFAVPFLVSGAFSAVNALMIYFNLPETHTPKSDPIKTETNFAVFRALFGSKISLYLWLFFTIGLGAGIYRNSFSLYMDEFYQLDTQHISYILASVGIFMAFCQGYLLSHFWLKKFKAAQILMISLLASSILFTITALYDQTQNPSAFVWVFLEICSVFFTIAMWPVLQSEGMTHADPDHRGEVNGYFTSLGSLTAIIWPLVGAWMVSRHLSPLFPAALASMLSFFWFLAYKKRF